MTNSNVETTQDMVIEGYALTFNTLSNDLGGFKERVLPNALDDVDIDDVKCLINHEDRYVDNLIRTCSNTIIRCGLNRAVLWLVYTLETISLYYWWITAHRPLRCFKSSI